MGEAFSDEPDNSWFPDVDYVGAWQAAEEAARALNAAVPAVLSDEIKAVPHTGPRGEAVVWLRPESVQVLALLVGFLAVRRMG
ncbi:hypothetical protein [Streptomyces cacaoi]|uniref:hypothetical protein n=1 Tax=Streptomyces cacaoi TaxID=1898 RepID=UPI003748C9F0